MGQALSCRGRCALRGLALCGLCGAHEATVRLNQSNQSRPVTRPLSVTGERESCSVLVEGGDASAWPPFGVIVGYIYREENGDTETMGRFVTRRFRPTRPPGRSGPMDRTAGGIGGAAPASLDLYGQSRTRAARHLTNIPLNLAPPLIRILLHESE